jgi:hypothetical protein
MDDATLLMLVVALFSLNYGGTWLVYKKINGVSMVIRILCREHQKNHGGENIEYEEP